MKITPTNSVSAPRVGSGGKPAAGQAFAVPETEEAAAPAAARASLGVSGVNSLDALIALQQVEEPLSRRKRAIARAGRLLDALDEVKLALLEESPSPAILQRLAAAVREERVGAEDAGLQGLLDQIETRAAVELAKMDQRRPTIQPRSPTW